MLVVQCNISICVCLWQMNLRQHLILLIMRPSDVSFVWSCSYSCESWPCNEGSDSSVLRRKLSDCISFFCVHLLWNPERYWLSWLYSYPCEHYLASFVSGLRGHSCFAFWNGQWPQTRAGFLSSRLSVWCTAIRHQNASQCLVIHWRPPVSSSVDLLKKQSLTRAFQARQRFHGGWRIIIELWHNRLPSSFAATRILHPNMWPNFECLLTALEQKWLQMVSSQQLVINKEPVLSAGTLSSNTAPFYAAKCPGRHKKGEGKNQKWIQKSQVPLKREDFW